ncbi:heterokaryon incompatibility protein-domain-containing protein, partial [Clohesyomyces aquaticus]
MVPPLEGVPGPREITHPGHPLALYSELPIYPPNGIKAAAQRTTIRLIELKPAFMGDSILCNMYSVSLQDNPQFTALSYTWGESKKTHIIHVRGFEIPVTSNLCQALVRLRKPDRSITLWVDALCINQDHLEERNDQVKQMPKIYSAAQEVVAWLGESTKESDAAMRLVTLPPKILERYSQSITQREMNDLLCRAYWTRVWVIQELAC